jgi:hypothetical protein
VRSSRVSFAAEKKERKEREETNSVSSRSDHPQVLPCDSQRFRLEASVLTFLEVALQVRKQVEV